MVRGHFLSIRVAAYFVSCLREHRVTSEKDAAGELREVACVVACAGIDAVSSWEVPA